MRLVSITGSIPTKRVTLADVESTDTDDALVESAMGHARETRSSLFGWNVDRFPEEGRAVVALWTD